MCLRHERENLKTEAAEDYNIKNCRMKNIKIKTFFGRDKQNNIFFFEGMEINAHKLLKIMPRLRDEIMKNS